MPNHVTNRVIVRGANADVAAFKAKYVTLDPEDPKATASFDFDAVIKYPKDLLGGIEESSTSEEGALLLILRAGGGAPYNNMGMYDNQVERIRADVGMNDKAGYQELMAKGDPDCFDRYPSMQLVAEAYLKKHPDVELQGKLRLRAIAETGYSGWYSWNCANWGTKWNAYSYSALSEGPAEELTELGPSVTGTVPSATRTAFEFQFNTAWSFPWPVFEKLAEDHPELSFEVYSHDEGDQHGGKGFFNPGPGQPEFEEVRPGNDETYELAHKEKRQSYDDEEAA